MYIICIANYIIYHHNDIIESAYKQANLYADRLMLYVDMYIRARKLKLVFLYMDIARKSKLKIEIDISICKIKFENRY